MTNRPPRDPEALADFPLYSLAYDAMLYRAHRAEKGVLYFSNDGSGRFDPVPYLSSRTTASRTTTQHSRPRWRRTRSHAYGTCYLSVTPGGAFLEKLGRLGPYLTEEIVESTTVTEVEVVRPLRIVDLTAARVIGKFYIDNDLSNDRDYRLSQLWGLAF